MVESTIDKIKDITVERQIRKLAGIIDEQNTIIGNYGDLTIDIQNLKDSDINQATQINNIKQQIATDKLATESAITNLQSKDSAQDGTLATHSEQIQGITESLVSNVQIIDGITTGEIKVRIDRESAASIDSNSYNLGLPVSAEIIQGTGPSMFKVQITMSSGVKVVSNDFVFTTEAIGTDVYISSFTFKAGNQDGYLSADIGLNNGVTIEANNFLVPTDPGVISNITDLQNRVTNLENTSVSDSRITAIENELNNKADITNVNQDITLKTATVKSAVQFDGATGGVPSSTEYGIVGGNDEKHPFTVTMKTEAFGQVVRKPIGELALLDGSGNPKNFTAGGEVWEEVNLSGWPTNWVEGDRIKIETWGTPTANGPIDGTHNPIRECEIGTQSIYIIQAIAYGNKIEMRLGTVDELNSGYIGDIANRNLDTNAVNFTYDIRTANSDYNSKIAFMKMWRLKK